MWKEELVTEIQVSIKLHLTFFYSPTNFYEKYEYITNSKNINYNTKYYYVLIFL